MNHLELFHAGIAECASEYQRAPFNFLFERDLQALLFCSCYRAFSGETIHMRGGYHAAADYGGDTGIDTVPVKCEYPTSRVFDIALIDADRLEAFDEDRGRQQRWKNDRFWDQRVRAAVEIKYYQLGDTLGHKARGFEADVAKLKAYADQDPESPFLGIALLFVQSQTLKSTPFCGGLPVPTEQIAPETGMFRYVVTPSSVLRFAA